MPLPELSDEQRQLVTRGRRSVRRGLPGAGKTRAIVARFLRRTEEEAT